MTEKNPSEIAAALGKRLRSWRRQKNYAIRTVAEDIGVSKQVVSEWERGLRFPCQKHLAAISEYTRIPVCALLRTGLCRCHLGVPNDE